MDETLQARSRGRTPSFPFVFLTVNSAAASYCVSGFESSGDKKDNGKRGERQRVKEEKGSWRAVGRLRREKKRAQIDYEKKGGSSTVELGSEERRGETGRFLSNCPVLQPTKKILISFRDEEDGKSAKKFLWMSQCFCGFFGGMETCFVHEITNGGVRGPLRRPPHYLRKEKEEGTFVFFCANTNGVNQPRESPLFCLLSAGGISNVAFPRSVSVLENIVAEIRGGHL